MLSQKHYNVGGTSPSRQKFHSVKVSYSFESCQVIAIVPHDKSQIYQNVGYSNMPFTFLYCIHLWIRCFIIYKKNVIYLYTNQLCLSPHCLSYSNKIKNFITLAEFKNQIKKWQGPKCLYNMCIRLLQNAVDLKLTKIYFHLWSCSISQ